MTADLQEIKSMLEAKREEVLSRIHRLEDITAERAPDPIDEMEMTTERESAITLLERDSELLRQIDAALRKVGNGDFGICDLCGKEIGSRRLRVLPWAIYCVTCQDEVDRSRKRDASPSFVAEPGV
jgi:DnaK suppressor protein